MRVRVLGVGAEGDGRLPGPFGVLEMRVLLGEKRLQARSGEGAWVFLPKRPEAALFLAAVAQTLIPSRGGAMSVA